MLPVIKSLQMIVEYVVCDSIVANESNTRECDNIVANEGNNCWNNIPSKTLPSSDLTKPSCQHSAMLNATQLLQMSVARVVRNTVAANE